MIEEPLTDVLDHAGKNTGRDVFANQSRGRGYDCREGEEDERADQNASGVFVLLVDVGQALTGVFQLILHKQATLKGTPLESLTYPLLETPTEFLVHGFSFPNYLADLGANAQSEIYTKSSLDLAMRDAFRKMRHFLMTTQGLSEDEAISLMSVAVDFGVTQVVDGNWGIHAIVKKSLFTGGES